MPNYIRSLDPIVQDNFLPLLEYSHQLRLTMSFNLYISLFLTGYGREAGKFHWGFFVSPPDVPLIWGVGGQKYHIQGLQNGWIADHGQVRNAFASIALVGFIRIGVIAATNYPMLPPLLQADDSQLNELAATGLTCRVWVLRALERLLSHGLIRAPSVRAIEIEATQFGETQRLGVLGGTLKPRVVDSTICQL